MELKPPGIIENILGRIPSSLPFEKTIDSALNNAEEKIASSPITKTAQNIHSKIPLLTEFNFPTPLGRIRVPEISVPEPTTPKLTENRREALKYAVGIDISSAIGYIPVVGDIIADVVEDVYGARLRKVLTPEEMDTYSKFDKLGPSTLAVLRMAIKKRK